MEGFMDDDQLKQLRDYAEKGWHRDQLFSSKVISAVMTELLEARESINHMAEAHWQAAKLDEHLHAQLARYREALGEAREVLNGGNGRGGVFWREDGIDAITGVLAEKVEARQVATDDTFPGRVAETEKQRHDSQDIPPAFEKVFAETPIRELLSSDDSKGN